jgi:hypothetical protein
VLRPFLLNPDIVSGGPFLHSFSCGRYRSYRLIVAQRRWRRCLAAICGRFAVAARLPRCCVLPQMRFDAFTARSHRYEFRRV